MDVQQNGYSLSLLRMIITSVLDFLKIVSVQGLYKLDQWEHAFEAAANAGSQGDLAFIHALNRLRYPVGSRIPKFTAHGSCTNAAKTSLPKHHNNSYSRDPLAINQAYHRCYVPNVMQHFRTDLNPLGPVSS